MDVMINAVRARQDAIDPAGKAARDITISAASQAQVVKASGVDPQVQASALRQVELAKEAQLTKLTSDQGMEQARALIKADVQRFEISQEKQKEQWELYDEIARAKKLAEEDQLKMAEQRTAAIENYYKAEYEGAIGAAEIEAELRLQKLEGYALIRETEEQNYQARMKEIGSLQLSELQSIALISQVQKKDFKARANLQQQYLQLTSNVLGAAADVAKTFGKKGFAAFKAFSISQAIIDTFAAANASYAWAAKFGGPIAGAVAAAAAVAAGIANVAQITGQKPQAHAGLEYVPQEATYRLQRGRNGSRPWHVTRSARGRHRRRKADDPRHGPNSRPHAHRRRSTSQPGRPADDCNARHARMSPEVKAEIEQLQGRVAALELSNAQVLVLIIAPLPTTDRELFLANAGIQHEDRLKRLATGLQGPSMDTLERICTSVLETCRGFDKHRKTQEQGN